MRTHHKLNLLDGLIATLLTVLVTWQPYVLHHEIIMMETGVHLPNLQGLFQGHIPFRDVVYWHGPFELYVPALMMLLFGKNSIILPYFYYIFSVGTLVMAVWIARELLKSRFVFYLFTFVVVARTFPRVAFYYWGGLRYALGLLAVLCIIKFFKGNKKGWACAAGVAAALSGLTTSEAGFVTVVSIAFGLGVSWALKWLPSGQCADGAKSFLKGILAVVVPYGLYLVVTGSLGAYIEATLGIAGGFTTTFIDEAGNHPESIKEFLLALFPGSPFHKYMTPVYAYAALCGYVIYRLKKGARDWELSALAVLGLYSLVLFITSWRAIWGHHFDMALQPEKIFYFFLIERGYFVLLHKINQAKVVFGLEPFKKRAAIAGMTLLIAGIFFSSVCYAWSRYTHRFVAVKLLKDKITGAEPKDYSLLAGQETAVLDIPRAKGAVVPKWQYEEITGVTAFLQKNTEPGELIFMYPEIANFCFWADRPVFGRFPIGSFAWVKEEWHRELVDTFKRERPRYAVMTKVGHRTFPEEWYFRNPRNRERYWEVTNFILENYHVVQSFEAVEIYKRNDL